MQDEKKPPHGAVGSVGNALKSPTTIHQAQLVQSLAELDFKISSVIRLARHANEPQLMQLLEGWSAQYDELIGSVLRRKPAQLFQ